MRLQVAIHRNTLPLVNVIYNTSSSPTPIKTISEFLAALDRVVPLESADGEWGLEDYVVEVAATSDQVKLYECLHYQLVKDVFSEDDEVVVRGLSSDEIKERRQGGRLQILPDGRHLFDGVAWGRRYNAAVAQRPGIDIPPRKRRRLLAPEEESIRQEVRNEEGDETQLDEGAARLLLEHLLTNSPAGMVTGELDGSDDDEDYEDWDGEAEPDTEDEEHQVYGDDDDYEDHEEEVDAENDQWEGSRQVVAREIFEDADSTSGESEKENFAVFPRASTLEEDELQLLLEEAGEIEDAYNSLPLEYRVTAPSKKRKRPDDKEVRFEGFPSSAPKNARSAKVVKGSDHLPTNIGGYSVTEPGTSSGGRAVSTHSMKKPPLKKYVNRDIENTSSSDEDSDFDSGSGSDSDSDTSSDSDSGSGHESDSGTESNVDTGDGNSSSEENSTQDTDSSDSDSNSDSESDSESETTSSSDSDSGPEISSTKVASGNYTNSSEQLKSTKSVSEPPATSKVNTPPGNGTKRTRANNTRAKLKKRLNGLKDQGILSPEADFTALRAYEEAALGMRADQKSTAAEPSATSQLAKRKEELLARLNAVYDDGTTIDGLAESQLQQEAEDSRPKYSPATTIAANAQVTKTIDADPVDDAVETEYAVFEAEEGRREDHCHEKKATGRATMRKKEKEEMIAYMASIEAMEQRSRKERNVHETQAQEQRILVSLETQKRARLDVESSRRMLFSSLGLRNPKTPAAEHALREKLSKSVRNVALKQQDEPVSIEVKASDESWKDKLIISAVECVQEGLVLGPPPFPFKQHWERDGQKKKARSSAIYDNTAYDEDKVSDTGNQDADVHQAEKPEVHPDRLSNLPSNVDFDFSPYPINIESYPDLKRDNIRVGVIIAYKQLHINAKFEPETSPYRVARIEAVKEDVMDLLISKTDRQVSIVRQYDDETGQRIYGNLEMPDDDQDDTEDDGLRETTYEDMIGPKLIESKADRLDANAGVADVELEDIVNVPDSVPMGDLADSGGDTMQTALETTGSQNMDALVSDSGIESVVDDRLLQPLDMPKTHQVIALAGNHTVRELIYVPEVNDVNNILDDSPIVSTSGPYSTSIMSQVDVDYPEPPAPTSSSFDQDAQPPSQVRVNVEDSDFSQLQVHHLNDSDVELSASIGSEVPNSQLHNDSKTDGIDNGDDPKTLPKLRGGDEEPASHTLSKPTRSDVDSLVTQVSPPKKTLSVQDKASHKASPFTVRLSPSPRDPFGFHQNRKDTRRGSSASKEGSVKGEVDNNSNSGLGAGRVLKSALSGLSSRRGPSGKKKT